MCDKKKTHAYRCVDKFTTINCIFLRICSSTTRSEIYFVVFIGREGGGLSCAAAALKHFSHEISGDFLSGENLSGEESRKRERGGNWPSQILYFF